MGQPITTDNIDDYLRNTLKSYFDDLKNRIEQVNRLVKEDLQLDKNQDAHSGVNMEVKIDQINNKVEKLEMNFINFREKLEKIEDKINILIQNQDPNQQRRR